MKRTSPSSRVPGQCDIPRFPPGLFWGPPPPRPSLGPSPPRSPARSRGTRRSRGRGDGPGGFVAGVGGSSVGPPCPPNGRPHAEN